MEYLFIQKYLLFLVGIMISAGIIKKNDLLVDVFTMLFKKIKSKKVILFLVSFFGGVLPVPGRVSISAGILDTIAPVDSNSRSKFGIIDYMSTHTYYLWSPLEKTVILPMAALGISYGSFLEYVWPLIAITFGYIFFYLYFKIEESDIQIITIDELFNPIRFVFGALPIFMGIFFVGLGFSGAYVFTLLAIYYILAFEENIISIYKYINIELSLILAGVLMLTVFIGQNYDSILNYIEIYKKVMDITTPIGFLNISLLAFVSSWILGSSGKYAGIVALLLTIYGSEYLVWFLTLEYAAYNLSPTHKCIHIGRMYFNTPISDYIKTILIWQILLLSYAFTEVMVITQQ